MGALYGMGMLINKNTFGALIQKQTLIGRSWPPYETCSAVQRHKIASFLQNSCTAKLQLFSSILEAKQQLNSSCSGMQKRCAAFEALGSCFAAQLPTLKCCEVAAVTLQFSFGRSDSATFLSVSNMNRQKSLATDYGFYNERTLTVPLRNASKLVRREDYILNKPPNSMLSE